MVDVKKFHSLAKPQNEAEINFESDLNDNSGLYKASMSVAMKVRRELRRKSITQAEFAKMLGVDAAVVSRYLNGKANLELKTMVRFEELLNIKIIDRTVNPDRKRLSDVEMLSLYKMEEYNSNLHITDFMTFNFDFNSLLKNKSLIRWQTDDYQYKSQKGNQWVNLKLVGV